ncbi:G-type lectin S-receptor-like serine/threonine-protein kinase SD2-5 [Coffea eugenioides]|uniref:Receptor-like serine/threonine-protein kinase n=1 Tax=Coffea arabica TaxID=13443 RepID=A0A6P6UIQ7_COFAR|nr:G-type lectin S-receptor-like serine/threonine-protein kinase SD2-5 [Coffea arabica]XP_027150374.1 G-type lectin S-receptor-like serine/threonine-protein kinase SD2-5 [Coffea eugenioides]
MDVEQRLLFAIFLSSLLLSSLPSLTAQKENYNSTAYLPASWINLASESLMINSTGSIIVIPVLLRGSEGPRYVCGFYCNTEGNQCLFGVLISQSRWSNDEYLQSPELVWSANRNNPVQSNATLQLRQDGDLVLANSDGTLIWSSSTRGKPVSGLKLTEMGNLVLFGSKNESIWESFDHPTDSLLLGQKLGPGQKLRASDSATNWSQGRLSLAVGSDGLSAYIESDPPQRYYVSGMNSYPYYEFRNGSLNDLTIPPASGAQFIKFEPDGHLKVYQWREIRFMEVIDLLDPYVGDCGYPMVCGNYGVCSKGQCGCIETTNDQEKSYFSQINFRQPNLGCSRITPISCDDSRDQTLLELSNTSYFAVDSSLDKANMGMEDCKSKCLSNCSCKAAVFYYTDQRDSVLESNGNCLLLNEVFSIINNEDNRGPSYNTTLLVKVQDVYVHSSSSSSSSSDIKLTILGCTFAVLACVVSLICYCLLLLRRILEDSEEPEGHFLNQVPGMPTRYSYEKLKSMTEDFSKKLGEGGFGSVYEGVLSNGTKIAVKCLDGSGQVKDSFLAEVQIIGSIHHVNLVKLIGFCFHKLHRLLVYQYMANGSLDKWICGGKNNQSLPWNARRRIITDIAKGLAYLHEDCSQKIIHFDIKPQNILLDQNFNAKVADFGLSKLVEKDQSRVITRMRGTPGYLAPEWLSSVITEKVDVYSFGIVMLEIICGRKNVDWSKIEEDKHLLSIFKRKAGEERLQDMVDKNNMDMLIHVQEAVEMMEIAAWCLQSDFTKRPSMSLLVKVLDGLVAPETNLDYDFTKPSVVETGAAGHLVIEAENIASQLLPSALSGPR